MLGRSYLIVLASRCLNQRPAGASSSFRSPQISRAGTDGFCVSSMWESIVYAGVLEEAGWISATCPLVSRFQPTRSGSSLSLEDSDSKARWLWSVSPRAGSDSEVESTIHRSGLFRHHARQQCCPPDYRIDLWSAEDTCLRQGLDIPSVANGYTINRFQSSSILLNP